MKLFAVWIAEVLNKIYSQIDTLNIFPFNTVTKRHRYVFYKRLSDVLDKIYLFDVYCTLFLITEMIRF